MRKLSIDKVRAIEQIYFTLDRKEREIAIQLGEGIIYEPDNEGEWFITNMGIEEYEKNSQKP